MPRIQNAKPLSHALLAAGLLSQTLLAAAQTAPEAKAEAKSKPDQVIVVSAQKRLQSIKEVPVAMSVLSSEQLEKDGLRDIGDLAKVTASLEFGDQKTGGAGGSASIRGIGTAVFTTSAESSVGVVVDGVALGNTAGGALFDLERVEVLRGPQGTLFGKNASAGVINMVSKAPVLKRTEGFAALELSGGTASNASLRVGLNAPISETSALRVTAHKDQLTGIYHNTTLNQDSKTDAGGVRARVLIKPSNDLVINLIGEHDTTISKGATFFAPFVAVNTTGHTALADFAACGVTVNDKNNQVCGNVPDYTRVRVQGLSGQIDYTLANGLTVTSITAARDRLTGPDSVVIDMQSGYDRVRNGPGVVHNKQFTQELRLASPNKSTVEWTAGAFLSDYTATKDDTTTILPPPFVPSPPVPRSITNVYSYNTAIKSKALFGQASFKVNEQLSVLGGLRYTADTVKDAQVQNSTVAFAPFALPTTVKTSTGESDKKNLSGKAGLQYALDKQTNFYATLSRGYKGPQVDTTTAIGNLASSGSAAAIIIKPEISTSLEAGAKFATADRKFDADVAVFRNKIQDFQEQNCTLTAIGALNCIPLNVPSVTSYGVEVDLRVRPLNGLTLTAGGAAILGTEYPTGFIFDSVNVGGQRLLYSPKGKLVLGAQYAMPVMGDYEWSIGADATYKTRVRLCNTLASECAFKAHAILGLRTALRSPDDKWGLALFVRNATDERVPNAILYPLPGKGAGSGYAYSLGANSFRSTGITADIRF